MGTQIARRLIEQKINQLSAGLDTCNKQVIDACGIDPYTNSQLPDDRIEMAKSHSNEKLAGKPVSHDHLFLTCPTGVICVNGKHIQLHAD
ncbi:MAG: hypothetical protein ABL925_02470 [Methylococcales bacterium]